MGMPRGGDLKTPVLTNATTLPYCIVSSGTSCAVSYSLRITGLGSQTII